MSKKHQEFDMHRTRITPDYARELLKINTSNRPFRHRHAKALMEEMKAGSWKFNGDTVRISRDNVLLDGQHKLWACAESGETIEVILVKGLPPDVFDTIDCGIKRTGGDAFSVRGEKNATLLAASLGLVQNYFVKSIKWGKAVKFSTTVLEAVLEHNPEVRRSVQMAGGSKVKFINASVLAACHYLFSRKDTVLADAFFDALISGANLEETDPVYVLRERLLSNLAAKWKASTPYVMAVTVKAWNAMRKSRRIRTLGWRGGEGSPEEFPVIE